MEVGFGQARMAALFNDSRQLRRKYGAERARKIQLRLDQMIAATTLKELCQFPQARCHELTSDRRGQFSLDLDGPYRLIVEPANEPVPTSADGGIDRSQVTRLRVLEIVDTHGK